jgi:microcin C transport system substrate-binding protein
MNRRDVLRTGTIALASTSLSAVGLSSAMRPARAQASAQWRHGLSLFGDIKYPADFKHFDYVSPTAPKGGAVRQIAIGTYDNLNIVVSGVKGNFAGPVFFVYETLMAASLDEVSTEYGLLAEAVSFPADFSSVTYRLRAAARWHDDKPVTPDDVIFSLEAFKKNHPQYAAYYRHVIKAEKTGERDITFTFDSAGNRELPQIVGQLRVLPKHWWEGADEAGKKRDVTATMLEKPLGSGAYRVKGVRARPHRRARTGQGLLGQGSARECRPR